MAYNSKPNLSFSVFDLYDTCPFRYKKFYIEHKWEKANKYLLYGSAFHGLIDKIYEQTRFILAFALQLWPKVLAQEKLKKKYSGVSKADLAWAESSGIRDINIFFELARNEGILRPAIAHECALTGLYRQHTLKAKLDLVQHIRGGIGIIDWKTGKADRKTLMQLVLYAVLYFKRTGQMVDWLCPFYLKNPEMVYQAFDKDIQEEAGDYFHNIYVRYANDKEFLPKTNMYCNYCSFKKLCGLW